MFRKLVFGSTLAAASFMTSGASFAAPSQSGNELSAPAPTVSDDFLRGGGGGRGGDHGGDHGNHGGGGDHGGWGDHGNHGGGDHRDGGWGHHRDHGGHWEWCTPYDWATGNCW